MSREEKLTFKEKVELIVDAPVNTSMIKAHEEGWEFGKELEAAMFLRDCLVFAGTVEILTLAYIISRPFKARRKRRRRAK